MGCSPPSDNESSMCGPVSLLMRRLVQAVAAAKGGHQ